MTPATSRQPERIVTGWLAAAIWLTSRAVMGMIWDARARHITYDVNYYFHWLQNSASPVSALVEYPTPVVWLLKAMHLVSGDSATVFQLIFVGSMFVLDGLVTLGLWHYTGRAAALYWTAFQFMIGSLIWFRIDLIPGAAVCLAMVWLLRRPFGSGAMIAVGAATKLWPAMLILPLVGAHRHGRARTLGFTIVGGLLGLSSLVFAGWERSISPLTWQTDRGLQIESIVASVPMWAHAFATNPGTRIHLSKSNAWEIEGPGTQFWIELGDGLMVATVILALLLAWLLAFGGAGLPRHAYAEVEKNPTSLRHRAMVMSTVALVCAVLVANKTFSPQYVIWLSGPLAVLIAQRGTTRSDRAHAIGLAALGLVIAFLTQQIFPLNYGGLIKNPTNDGPTTVLLLTRNALMVAMTLWAAGRALVLAWRVGLKPAAR